MPVSPPTDPDDILDLVKKPTTRWENNHLVLGSTDAWLAINDRKNAWTTSPTVDHQLSINTYNLLCQAEPMPGRNTFKVTTGGVEVVYQLQPQTRDGAVWAVAETI